MRTNSSSPLLAIALSAAALLLQPAAPARAQLRISEFMAANVSVTQDEDNAYSDWIEIYNASNAAVNLSGWHLTDTATNLTRWTFPATNLPAGKFLLVFASGKDRTAPRLHANFSLDADGEYLALVRPDGTTIEHEYAPFPEQFDDISYGVQTHGTNPTLRAGQPGFLVYRTPGSTNACLPAPHPIYSDHSVARIDLAISNDDWEWLHWGTPDTESFRSVNVRFRHGNIDLVVTNAGIQCRGNTSLTQYPRSFNIVFNAFVPGQKLLDLERININANVNDPSMARSKLVNDLHAAAGLPTSYANHVALVVSNTTYHYSFFDAVRDNTQPVDDVFLKQRFGTARGNLYKCLYPQGGNPATLAYRGATGAAYSGYGTTYELKYSGAGDASFTDFATFVSQINQTSAADFPNTIMNVFDVDGFLKRLALDALTGHWDDYWINGNNYHLFFNSESRRWTYIPYDFDNTFDIRWYNADWATQNVNTWTNISDGPREAPLASRILAVPEFKKRYAFYMKQILDDRFSYAALSSLAYHCRSNMIARLPFESGGVDNMKNEERDNYQWNWPGWIYSQFYSSYTSPQYEWNSNVPDKTGLLPFVSARVSSAYSQLGTVSNIAPILSDFALTPGLPRSNDAIAVSIRAFDDVAVTNVSLYYAFNSGATNVLEMPLQADGSYAANLPAFGATGTVRYLVRARDNTAKSTFHPYGGSNYAATVEIGSAAFDLVVSEINYNPYALSAAETAAGVTDAQNLEFVELFNAGNAPLALAGFMLQNGITATFPAFTLTNGAYAVVVKNTNQFRVRYTNSAIRIIGTFAGNLSNGGETLELRNAQNGLVASIAYSDSGAWPGRADGDGSTLELVDPAFPAYADPEAWRSSSEYGGSPGAAALGPDSRVVVNEVLTHTDPPLSDSIELFNATESALDIGGWFLSDAKSNYRKYRIPANTVLPAGGYIVFNETNHFNASANTNNNFSLDGAHGDDVYLLQAGPQSNLVRFADHVEFGAAANGESFGRWPNGAGRGVPMVSRTFGAANSGPRVGPVVISELMYNPPSGSNHLEFIEIANPGALPVNLTRWQIDSGVAYAFPTNTVLPAGGALVVVSFDPNAASNSALLASFRSVYGLSGDVPLLGPYAGLLDGSGEDLRLLRPDEPPAEEPAYYPMLIEDEVGYDDEAPWPLEADGLGASLERVLPAAWGDDPAGWIAAEPSTPGDAGEPVATFDLTVVSAHGSPVPSVGSHAIVTNTALSNSVPSPVVAGGTRYTCTGWTLANHDPAAGATNWMLMTLTNDATLAWLWNTNLLLSVSADPGGGVLPAGGWHAVGATVELQAVASNDFVFSGWTGDTNAIVSGSPASALLSVQLNAPVSLTAHFAAVTPTYHISPAGSHTAPYTTWGTASTSLQAAVDYAPSAATVLVAAATYPLASPLSIDKALTLKSSAGPGAAILDGGNSTRVLFLSHAEAVVDGFAIQNGNSGNSSGGGVRIEPGGQLANCIVRSNSALKYGGGAALLGGGELRNCLFHDNFAFEWGGGAYTYTESAAPLVQSCTFSRNSAGEGGGVYLNGSSALRNAIVWDNFASPGSNIFLSGSGQTIQRTLSGPAPAGAGNLGANPRFADGFRLAPDSPALNAGTNLPWMAAAFDLDSRPRVLYGTNDLGAYEGLAAGVDSDGDRVGDWQEFRAGTDPFDPGSVLDIVSAAKDTLLTNRFVLRWPSAAGRSYRIAFATNMASPFASVAYSNILAEPPANTFTGALAQPAAAYYRIEVEE